MAYKFREEIVGKRFLSVSGFTKLKVNKISEWGWRAGVIRAASHRDNGCHDLQFSRTLPTYISTCLHTHGQAAPDIRVSRYLAGDICQLYFMAKGHDYYAGRA
ncbi:hypothetical protein P5V15_005375 [Pogonomyrmex californicus]